MFSVYVDELLNKLNNYGCFINGVSYGSFMYADDLVLLAPSVHEMQKMIKICYAELSKIGLKLNEKKSFYLRFGKGWGDNFSNLKTDTVEIPRVLTGTYLGVDIVSGPRLTVNFHKQKRKFYSKFNAIYSKLGHFNNELVSLHLIYTVAIPCLLYGTEAFVLNKSICRSLELPWSRVFMKVFKTYNIDIVKDCQIFCGYKSVSDMILERRKKFIDKIITSNHVLLCNLQALTCRH